MARRQPRKQGESRVKWRTIIIPFSTLQFWVNFLIVLVVLAVALTVVYFQFLSPKAQARRIIQKAETQFEQSIVMGIKELAFEEYRTIQETLFAARKAFDSKRHKEAYVLVEQTLATIAKAMERLRSDEFYRKERSASVKFSKGSVEVQTSGSLGWRAVKKGSKLNKGDRIRTRSGSSCIVQFDDGSQLTIKSNSLVLIDELSEDIRTHTKNSAIKLLVSDVEASILRPTARGSRFLIETPGSVAQVRKARMNVRVNKNSETEFKLISGDVSVNAGGKNVDIGANDIIRVAREGKVVSRGRLLGVPILRAPHSLSWVVSKKDKVSVDFNWRSIKEAASYRLVVAADRFFANVFYDNGKLKTTRTTVGALTPGIYFWRVSSFDRKGQESLFSPFRVFRIIQDQTPPFFAMNDPIVLSDPSGGKVYMAGAVEPGSLLSINGVRAPIANDGSFRIFQNMQAGRKTIAIRAVDQAGNIFKQDRYIQ